MVAMTPHREPDRSGMRWNVMGEATPQDPEPYELRPRPGSMLSKVQERVQIPSPALVCSFSSRHLLVRCLLGVQMVPSECLNRHDLSVRVYLSRTCGDGLLR